MKNFLRLVGLLVVAFLVHDYRNWKHLHETDGPGAASEPVSASPPAAASQSPEPPTFTPDPRALQFVKVLLRDDFRVWADGGKTGLDWKWKRPVGMETKASVLVADYDANEVAADEKYKGKTLCVTGTIQEIGKDGFQNVFLSLSGGRGTFNSVHAFLSEEAARTAGKLVKGKPITLVCTGMGKVVGSPVLRDCDYLDEIVRKQLSEIDVDVDWMLHGHPSRRDATFDKQVAALYVVGLHLPATFTCWESGSLSDSCTAEMQAAFKAIPKEQGRAEYDELAKALKLPPRPKDDPILGPDTP